MLLEYLPYRKTEGRGRRYPLFSYFVERGYVVARVDIRGTGNSEGRLVEYEYTDQEQEDGEVVIDWLSKQPFSNGNVGMFGISWGAFNSIHMAMRNPPALKAIIALMGTDDLYQDDVHFIDGILHFDSYEVGQDVDNVVPGAPDYVIDEQLFHDRFDTAPWLSIFKQQQRDGPFWDRASLNERYDVIGVPTFVIGGWYDGYRDSVPRMLQHLRAPVKAMVGPWGHSWPNDGYPKPLMEWRHEAVRWFDHWLKERDTGILDEPPIRSLRARLAPARAGARRGTRAVAFRGRMATRARQELGPERSSRPHARTIHCGRGLSRARVRSEYRYRGGRLRHVVRGLRARPAPDRRDEPRL